MQLNERIMNFTDLVVAQDYLNEITVPKWKSSMTPSHYVAQAILELAELVTESGVSYKWWKKSDTNQIDTWNVKIEVIDAIHFIISAQILAVRNAMEHMGGDHRLEAEQQLTELGKTMYVGVDVLELAGQSFDMNLITNDGWINYTTFVDIVRDLGIFTSGEDFTYLDLFRLSYAALLQLVASVGLTSLEISAIYTAKMTLNQIRQSSGYKDGTYVKVQDGVEDNQKLKDLVENFLSDNTMSLARLTKNVRNRFFTSTV
jgi:dUTP pyrophosphatase